MLNAIKDKLKERFSYWEQEIRDEDVLDFTEYDLDEYISKSSEFKLYRYMPPEFFNIRNIETQTIHLSEIGKMNDIYEGLPCFDEELSYSDLKYLEDMARMTCFSENNNNILMWSHYASMNTGICVEYDIKKMKKDPFNLTHHLFPVIYDEKRHIKRNISSLIDSLKEINKAILDDAVYDNGEALDDILPLVLLKGKMWEYEQEWRIIYTKKQTYDINDNVLYEGNIKFECISAVYLGYRIHPEVKANIIEICKRISTLEKTVSVYQASLDKEGYNINFKKIL